MKIHKKVVTDERGKPTEVILPFEEYREIEDILGLDVSEADQQSIKAAQEARRKGRMTEFHPLGDQDHMYRVVLYRDAWKFLTGLDHEQQNRIRNKLKELKAWPVSHMDSKAMAGEMNYPAASCGE